MYEQHHQQPIARRRFLRRLVLHFGGSLALVIISIVIGMIGYHVLEGLSWLDAFLNASMLLGGMGPVESPLTAGGKLFAGFYALYSGLIFLVAAGIVLAPAMHRMLHLFHWEDKSNS
jgi:hypothetical protein